MALYSRIILASSSATILSATKMTFDHSIEHIEYSAMIKSIPDETPTSPSTPRMETRRRVRMVWGWISISIGIVSILTSGIPLGITAVIVGAVAMTKRQKIGAIGVTLGIVGFVGAFAQLIGLH
jgi:hypothetical protein